MEALKLIESTTRTRSTAPISSTCVLSIDGMNGLGVVATVATAGVIAEIAKPLLKFLGNLGVTNDNGVIAARDKIAQYVTQVLGNRDAAYKQLYSGFSLAHADIPNAGFKSVYIPILDRLNQAAIKYIMEHSRDSNVIFGEDVDPKVTLDRYVQFVSEGKPLDHAFWLAFTGKKDPYDIRTGNALPKAATTTTDPIAKVADTYQVLRDAAGTIIQVRDAANNIINPGTPQYNNAVNPQPTEAGMGNVGGVLIGVGVLAGLVYLGSTMDDAPKKKLPPKRKK